MRILSTPETTEVIDGAENIDRRTDKAFHEIKEQLDGCFDQTDVAGLVTIEHRRKNVTDLAKRGIRMRYITNITKDNIQYCKEMLKIKGQELRHLDGAKGNFAIADRTEYMNILVEEEGERPAQALVSNVRSFVEQQQYSFDTLWQKAIPAPDRIKEIEEGIRPDFIETIRDATEIQKIGFDLIKSSKEEILILFSTPESIRRQARSGLMQLLKEVAIQKHVRIRILVHITNEIRKILGELNQVQILNSEIYKIHYRRGLQP